MRAHRRSFPQSNTDTRAFHPTNLPISNAPLVHVPSLQPSTLPKPHSPRPRFPSPLSNCIKPPSALFYRTSRHAAARAKSGAILRGRGVIIVRGGIISVSMMRCRRGGVRIRGPGRGRGAVKRGLRRTLVGQEVTVTRLLPLLLRVDSNSRRRSANALRRVVIIRVRDKDSRDSRLR